MGEIVVRQRLGSISGARRRQPGGTTCWLAGKICRVPEAFARAIAYIERAGRTG
jgi:hypothetical protein